MQLKVPKTITVVICLQSMKIFDVEQTIFGRAVLTSRINALEYDPSFPRKKNRGKKNGLQIIRLRFNIRSVIKNCKASTCKEVHSFLNDNLDL